MKTKILVIKLGYSETLDSEVGRTTSLGDVLRTTPILWAVKERYPDSHVTWLVDREAEPLLHGNRFIDRILVWDEFMPFQIMREKYDVLINLEKIAGICALSDMIDAWVKYGFRFDSISGRYHAYERGLDFIDYIEKKKTFTQRKKIWQRILIEMMGVKWTGQGYIIGYKPRTKEVYDVGLNYKVGEKWPHKAMSMERWRELEKELIAQGNKVSWQEGVDDLYAYMDWINSCRVIVSNDSLGLHLAFAFRKKIIGLFGPTDSREVFFYGNGMAIYSKERCGQPCYGKACSSGLKCMERIDIKQVVRAVQKISKG